jgi:hemerythrin-like domain-containing protein
MNAIDLLKQDHRIVDNLFKMVESTPPSKHEALFKRIKGELDTHAHIEEKIFYPALKKAGDKELVDIVLEGVEEHLQMKMFLGQLDGMSSKREVFEPKLKVLIEDTRHHVKEEENEMFKMAEDQLGSETLEKLGERMEKEKAKYQKANNITPEDPAEHAGVLSGTLSRMVEAVSGLLSSSGGEKKKPSAKSSNGSAAKSKAANGSASKAANGSNARSKSKSASSNAKSRPAAKRKSPARATA